MGWAIDEGIRLARLALEGQVRETGLPSADAVLAVWWEPLLELPDQVLEGKRVLCHMTGEPWRYLAVPRFRRALERVGLWIARTGEAHRQLGALNIECVLIPHLVDTSLFRPVPDRAPELRELRRVWGLPRDRYLIGSFQRDTQGSDLASPKRIKGPDVLLEIGRLLEAAGEPVHLVLAGPRRHWVRRELAASGISHTYIGRTDLDGDDLMENRLSRSVLNLLYNLLDLYVVGSRSEGAPNSILEAAASGCPIISTPVGLAHDVLEPCCVYGHVDEAVAQIRRDLRDRVLKPTTEPQRARVLERHQPEAARSRYEALFADIERVPAYRPSPARRSRRASAVGELRRQVAGCTVGVWHRYVEPPWGGGNQFMRALRSDFHRRGIQVREFGGGPWVDAYLLNGIYFDVDAVRRRLLREGRWAVHRIDGPIELIRGFDREKDELCFELNQAVAGATVVQSAWSLERMVELGYRPVSPVIIHNAADPDLFHTDGRVRFSRNRKIRLISTSWSPNERKGGPIYRWLERNIDWDRFDYTFVGRVSVEFDRARHVPPVPPRVLGQLLRQHDVYIAASRYDPCSNALVEALTCGLPALYMDDGGHPELVGAGGLPFREAEELPQQLDRLVESYESFQRLIDPPRMGTVAPRYLALLRDVGRCS